mmetsp:Transcript_14660/g.43583  ORF Transcript_14660/g.43583 Transcript_14660/m.43583 type:complete len:410 (-) Transcript_14660:289-1518(-)
MGDNPQEAAAMLLQQQQQFASMATMPHNAVGGSKKQRELYIGNLPPTANEGMIKELFCNLVAACEGFVPMGGPPVLNAQIAGGGQFAFVEFRDEQLCETAMQFNGIDLQGRQLKIGHPNGYIPPMTPVQQLKPPKALLERFGLTGGIVGDRVAAGVTQDTKKQRELYIGNLAVGAVTPVMLKELFTVPLSTLPEQAASQLPPVLEARVDPNGKFAFIEFASEELCTTALNLFNGMELCGREMKIARPAGYVPPPAGAAAGMGGMGGMMGGMGGAGGLGGGMVPQPPPGLPPGLAGLVPTPPSVPPPAAPNGDKPMPTHEISLGGILSAAVLADAAEYAECVEDIRSACEEHGKLLHFSCPKEGEPDAGNAYLKYEQIASAVKAFEALNGRDFDGNTVKATFLSAGTLQA